MFVSFVVIAYNEERHIAETLRSIAVLDGLEDYEIVVVDDASTDGTAQQVRSAGDADPRVRLVALTQNAGRGNARAQGVAAATSTDYIAMVDSDITLPRHWLTTCLAAEADGAGGIALPDGDVSYVFRRYGLTPRPVPQRTEITGNNGLFRAAALRAVSYDAALRDGEDIAVNHALKAAGSRLLLIDDLYVEHSESKSFPHSLQWLYTSGLGAHRQLVQYRTLRGPDVATAGFFAVVVAALTSGHPSRKALPAAYLGAAATAHLWQRFDLKKAGPTRAAAAVAADSALLAAYFGGRAAAVALSLRPKRA